MFQELFSGLVVSVFMTMGQLLRKQIGYSLIRVAIQVASAMGSLVFMMEVLDLKEDLVVLVVLEGLVVSGVL